MLAISKPRSDVNAASPRSQSPRASRQFGAFLGSCVFERFHEA